MDDSRSTLPNAHQMVREAWDFYKAHGVLIISAAALFVGIDYLTRIGFSGIGVLADSLPSDPTTTGIALLVASLFAIFTLALVGIFCAVWGSSVSLAAVVGASSGSTFTQVLGVGMRKLPAFIWIAALYVFVVVGGLALFILPGLYFLVALSFAPILLFTENERGLSALIKSHSYTVGRLWSIIGKNAYVLAISLIVMLGIALVMVGLPVLVLYFYLPEYLGVLNIFTELFNGINAVTVVPFATVFYLVLLRHVQTTRTPSADTAPMRRGWYVAFAFLGLFVLLSLLTLLALGTFVLTAEGLLPSELGAAIGGLGL